MIKNHIKTAWRNLIRRKWLSAIHVLGLGVAFAAAILLFLTAMFEFSFDDFHREKNRIAMVHTKNQPEGNIRYNSAFPVPFAPLLKSEIPEVSQVSRYANGGVVLRNGDKQFESNNKFVDPEFLSIFSFPFVKGDENALVNMDHVIVDETAALHLFNTLEVTGQQVDILISGQWTSKIIGGVLKRTPTNSSLTFNTLLRFEHFPGYLGNTNAWNNRNHWVFAKVSTPTIQNEKFTAASRTFMKLYFNEDPLKANGGQADENGDYISLHLLPMSQFHLNNKGLGNAGSEVYPWILLLIAGLILFTACSNFVNLSLAGAFARNREIGTRKTLGGSASQLMGQFWVESFLVCAVSTLIGAVIAWLVLPEYNAILNYSLQISALIDPKNLSVFLMGFLALTLIAGGYPAWRITRTHVIQSLKGTAVIKANRLQSSLTILQFTIAIALIISTIVIGMQIQYLANRPLGFVQSEVISLPIGNGIEPETALHQMRYELAMQPWVQHVSGSDINIGRGRDGSNANSQIGFEFEGRRVSSHFRRIDFDYLKTLGIQLIAGRDIDQARVTDTASVLINRQMAEQLGGIENILDKHIDIEGNPQVVGVVDDFNFQSLRNKIEPLTLSPNPNSFDLKYIFIRVNTDRLGQTLAQVEQIWKKINPKATIPASFLDENTQNQYRSEQRFAQIVVSGAIVAVFISCLGLFALTLLTINKRVKEIGIRKVLGSSVSGIVLLLSKDFARLLLISFLIASPIGWWLMYTWLRDYAFHIDIPWWVFIVAGSFTAIIALAAVSGLAIRAAVANPVDSLRDE